MGWLTAGLNRHRSELLVSLLRAVTYLGLAALFFGFMGIPHPELRRVGRVFASTLITWGAVTLAMVSVYGGYDVGRKKNRPITSSMALGNLIVCLVTDLQLRFLSLVGDREPLVIFDAALGWLALCVLAQTLFIYGMVRAGNWLYYRLHLPRART